MDQSLVHCHRICEFEPRHRTLFFVCFFPIIYFYQFIYLFKDIFQNNFQTITLTTQNNKYPIEVIHSVASRICVFVYDNVPFDEHFV